MPAKQDYLSSPLQRVLKITAGILGGYFLSLTLHLALAAALPYKTEIMLTATFTLFIFWVAFMVIAFLAKSGWKIWGLYLLGTTVLSLIIYFLKP